MFAIYGSQNTTSISHLRWCTRIPLPRLIIYINTTYRCRHKTFADYFGEETPSCVSRCDACADERSVRRALEQHMRRAQSATLGHGGLVAHTDHADLGDLYGGGRFGQAR